jgi:cytochrome c553
MTYPLLALTNTTLRAFACWVKNQVPLFPTFPIWTAVASGLFIGAAHADMGSGGTPQAELPLEPSVALGRHIAVECSACHPLNPARPAPAANGTAPAGGVPLIVGRPAIEIVELLKSYANGTLANGHTANPTMTSVARSLDPSEMAAVAAYLATLPRS